MVVLMWPGDLMLSLTDLAHSKLSSWLLYGTLKVKNQCLPFAKSALILSELANGRFLIKNWTKFNHLKNLQKMFKITLKMF